MRTDLVSGNRRDRERREGARKGWEWEATGGGAGPTPGWRVARLFAGIPAGCGGIREPRTRDESREPSFGEGRVGGDVAHGEAQRRGGVQARRMERWMEGWMG